MNTQNFSTIIETLEQYKDLDELALICGDEKLTFQQLLSEAKNIACNLVNEGVKKGDRVIYSMRRSADAVLGLLGILYAGGVFVSADPNWPEERINFIAKDSESVFSMTDKNCRNLREKKHNSIKLPDINPEDEAAIFYTSGSTGRPKGAVLHHAVLVTVLGSSFNTQKEIYSHWNLSVCFFNMSFIAAFIVICLTYAIPKPLLFPTDTEFSSVELITDIINRNHADVMSGTPSVISRFLEKKVFADAFKNFKYVFLGGELITSAVLKKLSNSTKALFLIIYGSTEMFFSAEYIYRNDEKIYLGQHGYGVSFYIFNDKMEEVSPNHEGSLFIGSTPAEYGHYFKQPRLDAEAYVEHVKYGRLFRTGDIARLEPNGEITLVGRADRMIKLHGQRIEIGEIENAVSSFPGVKRVATVNRIFAGHEALCVFYTADKKLNDRDLRRHLAKLLPYYMIPAFLRYLPKMPENAHGKLDYRALPAIEIEKPLVSILTPVNDSPLELLRRVHTSVLTQDYDKENIEWLIAVHNMDDDYINNVRELFADIPYIHIFTVNEPKKVLGAVRNALLERSTGRYLFWLDSDDELNSECISRSVDMMENYQADMLLFQCEEIHDGAGIMFQRCMNFSEDSPLTYEKGDPRLGELTASNAAEIWSWCYRSSFLKKTGIRFNEDEVGHFCDSVFVLNALVLARRVTVLPKERQYIFHIRSDSDSQKRAWKYPYKTCSELIRMMKKVEETGEKYCFNMNLFMWFWIRNLSYIFNDTDSEKNQKQEIYNAMKHYVKKLSVITSNAVFSEKDAEDIAVYVAFFFPEETENFKKPRFEHELVSFSSLPSVEKIKSVINALKYDGFNTLPDKKRVYLGKVSKTKTPEILTVDLQKNTQINIIQGFQNTEELRGFEVNEVPCRITLFLSGNNSGEILVTWDSRFIHKSAVKYLLNNIYGSSE